MIGKTISHYRILEQVGGGGMGVVYKAEDTKLHRFVALKFLPQSVAPVPHTGPATAAMGTSPLQYDRQALERFQREAQAASALNHPNICTIHDIDEYEGQPFIAMELLEGQTLKQRLARPLTPCPSPQGRGWPVPHAGPGEGATDTPTGSIDPAHLTSPGVAMGTIAYMSPEQALGKKLDARTDLFSFGVVLYQAVTGRPAFTGATTAAIFDAILHQAPVSPVRLNPNCPLDLERIINRLREKDRDLRYQSAADLRSELKRLKRDTDSGRSAAPSGAVGVIPESRLPASASGPLGAAPGPAPPALLAYRSRWVWVVAALAVAIVLGFVAWSHFARITTRPETALKIVPFTSSPGLKGAPAFSPDGNELAFVWFGEKNDNPDIYVKLIGALAAHCRIQPAEL